MNKRVRSGIFVATSVLFIAICSYRVIKTYNEISKAEGIFEGFLIATIAGYNIALIRNLYRQPEEVNEWMKSE